MLIRPVRTRIFKENEALVSFIIEHVKNIREGTVLVVTSKIVALAEGRVRTIKTTRERERLIKAESMAAIKAPGKRLWFTLKDGMLMTSAGMDVSNGNGATILLPNDSFKAAQKIRTALRRHYRLKNLGVIVSDSRRVPLRLGIFGLAIGYAGFKGINDQRGKPDIFGRVLRAAMSNVADTLAAGAVLLMGEGAERQPLALVTDVPVEFTNRTLRGELAVALEGDIFKPAMRAIRKRL